MEGHLAVEHHQHHTGDGDGRADVDVLAQALPAAGEQLSQDHRQDGGQGYDDADVGGVGVGQGGVLQEEVEAAAGDADEDEHQLILPGELQCPGAQGPQGHIGQAHAQGDDLNGGVAFQKLLGQYEAAAPHENGEDGVDMPHHLLGCFHMLSLLKHGFPASAAGGRSLSQTYYIIGDAGRKIQRELQKKFCGEIRQILKSGGAKAVEAGRKLCYTVRCGRQV